MTVTIKTFRPGPPPIKAAYENSGPFRFSSDEALTRRRTRQFHAPSAPLKAAHPGVYLDEDFDLVSVAYPRPAGYDVILQLETSPYPLLVAVGDSATEGGTYIWSEFTLLQPEEMLRATLTAAFYRTKTRNVLDQDGGTCFLVHQVVPASFVG